MLTRGTERTKLLTLIESDTNRDLGGGAENVIVPVSHTYSQDTDTVEYTFGFDDLRGEELDEMHLHWYARLTILPLVRVTAEVKDGKCSFSSLTKTALARGASLTLYALKGERQEVLGAAAGKVSPARKIWTSSNSLTTWPAALSKGILPLQQVRLDGVLWRVHHATGEDFKPIIDWNEDVPVSLARRPEIKNTMLPGILYQIAYELLRRSQAGVESSGSVEEQWRHLIPGTSLPSSGDLEDPLDTACLAEKAAEAVKDWGTKHPVHLKKLIQHLETLGDDE